MDGRVVFYVRTLLGLDDMNSGAYALLSDADIAAALQRHGEYVELLPLRGIFLAPSGDPTVFVADRSPWGSATLYGGNGAVLTPASDDPVGGVWTFATPPGSVWVSGWWCDPYAAAAELAERLAAREAFSFDVDIDQQSLKRSQKFAHFREVAASLWGRARPRLIRGDRADAAY